jgi:hypothetical protein
MHSGWMARSMEIRTASKRHELQRPKGALCSVSHFTNGEERQTA